MRDAELGGKIGGFAGKRDRRTPSRLAAHFNIAPAHAVVPSGSQRLHGSFFGRETSRISLDAIGLRIAIPDFSFGENALYEALPEARNCVGDPWNFGNINPGADDHRSRCSHADFQSAGFFLDAIGKLFLVLI